MYAIIVTPHFYQGTLPKQQEHFMLDDKNYRRMEFDTRDEAQAIIDERNEGIYYLDHGEYSRPDYKIIDLEETDYSTSDCLVSDGTELYGYKPVSADRVPEKIREALLAANVEYHTSEDTYDVYSAYEGDYAIIYCPRTVALELNADDLSNLIWDNEAFAVREGVE
jgi:hypothetical protein